MNAYTLNMTKVIGVIDLIQSYIKKAIVIIFISLMLFLLYMSSKFNYLLFHSIAELFSICIAFSVFTITLTSRKYLENNYYLVVGVAYFFVGVLDLFHTLSYKGMPIFTDYDFYANQLWIAARYLESISLLVALFMTKLKNRININYIMIVYFFITLVLLLSIFIWHTFPICFIENVGLTPFKKNSEYLIIIILLLCLFVLYKRKKVFNSKIYFLVNLSIIFTILSEFSFTNYINNYGFMNVVGHYFKIFSFYLIYVVIIKNGIQDPYDTVFREMKLSEFALSLRNDQLKNLSIRDSLTSLYNHGYLYEFLIEEENRSKRVQDTFAIIMLDIDYFKHINDTYGHIKGDVILYELSIILKSHLRESDIVGRYGGEEFLIVLVHSNGELAYQVAEKIRKSVEEHIFSNGLSITLSLGISEYDGTSISQLIERADSKMYMSKRAGRNQTTI